jgi:carbon starvation protein CstA
MLILILPLVGLLLGYLFYSRLVTRVFIPYKDPTPAISVNDGVDYVPMPKWKNYLIQLLNIAGTGPIFGALMGAKWGPIVILWIVFGTILGGAVHDYMAGMISVRNNGMSSTGIVTKYMGKVMRYPILILIVFLMIMVSATFARSASDLLTAITGVPFMVWLAIILIYFLVSSVLPIDKVIGRMYPIFGILLLTMAVTVIGGLILGNYEFPSLTLENLHPTGEEYLPDMFITVACGAISGFHATQSPMVSRCIQDEKDGRTVFYGAMVLESVIATIWALAGMTFYGDTAALADALGSMGSSGVVYSISTGVAGLVGGIMAVIGVIICPITSGDTALRAARLMIEEDRQSTDKSQKGRFVCVGVLLIVVVALCMLDFTVLWNYFSWLNQMLACLVLWAATVFILVEVKNRWYSLITAGPALFMTLIVSSFIMYSPLGLHLDYWLSIAIGTFIMIAVGIAYVRLFLYKGKLMASSEEA